MTKSIEVKRQNKFDLLRDALASKYGEQTRLDCIPLIQHCETGLLTALLRSVDSYSPNARTRLLGHSRRMTLAQLCHFLQSVLEEKNSIKLLDLEFRWNEPEYVLKKFCPV